MSEELVGVRGQGHMREILPHLARLTRREVRRQAALCRAPGQMDTGQASTRSAGRHAATQLQHFCHGIAQLFRYALRERRARSANSAAAQTSA